MKARVRNVKSHKKVEDLKDNGVRSFLPYFAAFVNSSKISSNTSSPAYHALSDDEFRKYLKEFLCSRQTGGALWHDSFKFYDEEQLNCLTQSKTPRIKMMTFNYKHKA